MVHGLGAERSAVGIGAQVGEEASRRYRQSGFLREAFVVAQHGQVAVVGIGSCIVQVIAALVLESWCQEGIESDDLKGTRVLIDFQAVAIGQGQLPKSFGGVTQLHRMGVIVALARCPELWILGEQA